MAASGTANTRETSVLDKRDTPGTFQRTINVRALPKCIFSILPISNGLVIC